MVMRRLFTIFFLFVIITGNGQSLKVMSYNLRFDNPGDGVNQWGKRKEKVIDLLNKYNPDILGVQEALQHQIKDITGMRKDYTFVGVGRDDGRQSGEYSAIIFKKDRFQLLDQNTFWLSETPEEPGSKSWDAAITRVATWAVLIDKESSRKFVVINTHFDHIGVEARQKSAELLKSRAAELGHDVPVIITGDFNSERTDSPYLTMVDGSLIELIDPVSQPEGTYCTFQVASIPCKAIDYIFVTNEWNADAYMVIKDNDGTYYPSDHLPVIVTLSLTE
jgi:endonuclease/exonuclease/phosphatase family metal-dependent hydrolase